MKLSLFNRILIGYTIALLLIMGLGALHFRSSFRLTKDYQELQNSSTNVLLLEQTGSLVKDIQRAHRGFIVTRDKRFLDPYYTSLETMPQLKARIQTSPDWLDQEREELNNLLRLINAELDHADDALFDTTHFEMDAMKRKIVEGKAIVDSINVSLGRLKRAELSRQHEIQERIQNNTAMNKTIIVSSIITFVILLILGLSEIYRVIRERYHLFQDLNTRTADLSNANEQLNVLNEELNASNENLSSNIKILERVQVELSLREKQLISAQVIARTGSFTFNTHTNEFSHSDSYARIFELEEGEKISSFEEFLSYVHPEDRERISLSGRDFLRNSELMTQKFRLVVNGKTKYINAAGQIVDQQEEGPLFLGAITDVTELSEVRERLQEANRKLIQSNTELEAFTYSISHDLKAPVRSMLMYVHLLLDKPEHAQSEEERKWLNVLLRKARHMDELIEGLLLLSRFGSAALQMQEVNMADLVKDVVDELIVDYPRAKVTFASTMGKVFADEGRIRQVWVNLIGNALKFSSKEMNPHVVISRDDKNDFVFFSIRDNGVGFDEERAAELFTVFKRLHSNDEFGGSGIGLAIVKRIVMSHGGDIEAHGSPGNGSVFIFRLPNRNETRIGSTSNPE